MEKVFEFVGGRKMFFAIVLLLIATIHLIFSGDFQGWSDFTIWIFGSYAVGNGVEHIATKMIK
jgi:hypothetical protein